MYCYALLASLLFSRTDAFGKYEESELPNSDASLITPLITKVSVGQQHEEYRSANGVLTVNLDIGLVESDGLPGVHQLVGFNGKIGGPTIRVRPGDHLRVNLVNRLPVEPCSTDVAALYNEFHSPYTTSFHVHGLHVSPESEKIVTSKILPGQHATYDYHIPDVHMGGTYWYHPHPHGASSVQAGGGALGLLIVEDQPGDLPSEVASLTEVLLRIQYFSIVDLANYALAYGRGCMEHCVPVAKRTAGNCTFHISDETQQHSFDYPGLRVNGVTNPEIHMQSNQWYRFRMLFVPTRQHTLEPDIPEGCEFKLLSKDGYYLQVAPRDIVAGFMVTGNRADWLVRCSEGVHTLETIPRALGHERARQCTTQYCSVGHHTVATLRVAGATPPLGPLRRLSPFSVPRPCYLGNMMHISPDYSTKLLQHTIYARYSQSIHNRYPQLDNEFSHLNWKNYPNKTLDFLLNDHMFDAEVPFATLEVGKIWQVEVFTPQIHPLHIHGNPFQLVEVPPMLTHSEYFLPGDFQDVLGLPYEYDYSSVPINQGLVAEKAVIKLQIDRFTGQSLIHCHIYWHSDHGMAGRLDYVGEEGTTYPGLHQCYYDNMARNSMAIA